MYNSGNGIELFNAIILHWSIGIHLLFTFNRNKSEELINQIIYNYIFGVRL